MPCSLRKCDLQVATQYCYSLVLWKALYQAGGGRIPIVPGVRFSGGSGSLPSPVFGFIQQGGDGSVPSPVFGFK